jgi:general secretion pathway protein G
MNRRSAFTLLELVIVILILGIIAAVAVPRMANQTQTARDNSARQSLGILRNAIELYNAKNNSYPASTEANPLGTSLAEYLNGPLPAPGVGYHADSNVVSTDGMTPSASTTAGWLYDPATGNLKINGTSPYGTW